jgi:hypothetical protein
MQRSDTFDRLADDERMHVVGALIGVQHLEVDQVTRHAEVIGDAVPPIFRKPGGKCPARGPLTEKPVSMLSEVEVIS